MREIAAPSARSGALRVRGAAVARIVVVLGVMLGVMLGAGCDDGMVHLSVAQGAPWWLHPAVAEAAAFMNARAADDDGADDGAGPFVIDDAAGAIVVRVESARFVDEDRDGRADVANAAPGEVVLDGGVGDVDALSRKCIVAHELGHVLGLQHVEAGLMSSPHMGGVDDCAWTEDDEAELQRARQERSGRRCSSRRRPLRSSTRARRWR